MKHSLFILAALCLLTATGFAQGLNFHTDSFGASKDTASNKDGFDNTDDNDYIGTAPRLDNGTPTRSEASGNAPLSDRATINTGSFGSNRFNIGSTCKSDGFGTTRCN